MPLSLTTALRGRSLANSLLDTSPHSSPRDDQTYTTLCRATDEEQVKDGVVPSMGTPVYGHSMLTAGSLNNRLCPKASPPRTLPIYPKTGRPTSEPEALT